MKTTLFLSLEEVLALHERTIKVHGGKPGVRDMGLLESAVLRCQSGYYNSLSTPKGARLSLVVGPA